MYFFLISSSSFFRSIFIKVPVCCTLLWMAEPLQSRITCAQIRATNRFLWMDVLSDLGMLLIQEGTNKTCLEGHYKRKVKRKWETFSLKDTDINVETMRQKKILSFGSRWGHEPAQVQFYPFDKKSSLSILLVHIDQFCLS